MWINLTTGLATVITDTISFFFLNDVLHTSILLPSVMMCSVESVTKLSNDVTVDNNILTRGEELNSCKAATDSPSVQNEKLQISFKIW